MGERVDAESVREVMFRYFHTMRAAIERHGGTVEKFVGDAVMAVFGVPVAHEDDALRAVRAAWEMQQLVVGLNEELLRRVGSTIALRIGVHTGEVVAGDSTGRETFVTGDAVNTAARLEQAASPGEVLIGEPTFRLVRSAVEVDAVDPVAAKGKAEPVPAYRLRAVRSLVAGRARRLGGLLVGRRDELAALRGELEQALGRCRLTSVIGEPGVGKSRLVKELVSGADALVLEGRCLSYGEGITYWPLAEILRTAAGIYDETSVAEARERLAALAGEPSVATPLELTLGLGDGSASPETIAWATRTVLEQLSEKRLVVVVLDDLHWAEEALLDLVEHVACYSMGRILLVGLARPELLERRPEWPGTILRLAPLSTSDVDTLSRPRSVSPRRSSRRCGEPRAATLSSSRSWLQCSRTIQTPQSPPRSRSSSGRGSTGSHVGSARPQSAVRSRGRSPTEGAVEALSDGQGIVRAAIEQLVEHDLCVAAEAAFADDAAYRFRHILLRDAAYRGIAKRSRAELHERFADWLSRRAEDRVVEVEEIVGYHLEQDVLACRARPVRAPRPERSCLRPPCSGRDPCDAPRRLGCLRQALRTGRHAGDRWTCARRVGAGRRDVPAEAGPIRVGRSRAHGGARAARALEDERLELAVRVELTFLRTVVHGTATGDGSSRPHLQRRAGWKRSAHRSSVAVP